MGRHPVSISLERRELQEIDRFAKQFHQTRSAFFKVALADYIRRLQFEQLRQVGKALAQAKGFFTDDDIFRVVS